jgi:hypothetical protein
MDNIVIKRKSKQNFSYKLDISITPNEKQDELKNHYSSNGYLLTEYHDSVSGLIMRFKGTTRKNDNQCVFSPVDDFDQSGTQTEFPDFPLNLVFDFLFSIGEHFHYGEDHLVIKWPEYLEKVFGECGVTPRNLDDYSESNIWDMGKEDKDFFELIGKPKISNWSAVGQYQEFKIDTEEIRCNYSVKLKIFWSEKDEEEKEEALRDAEIRANLLKAIKS